MSQRRQEKLSSLYRKTISEFFQQKLGIKNAVFNITRVELSEKLDYLHVYFSIWPDEAGRDMLQSLEALKRELRKHLAEKIKVKFVPEIKFSLDEAEKKRAQIEELLKKTK